MYDTFKFVTNLLKIWCRICRSCKVIPPCSRLHFTIRTFPLIWRFFLPLNISVKKHRPPHGGEAIFQVVRIFNKEDGHTSVLCGTLLYRGNKSNSRAVSQSVHLLFRVYKLVYNLISWQSSLHLPLFYWTTYGTLVHICLKLGGAGRVELYHGKLKFI